MEVKIYREQSVVGYFEADVKLRLAPSAYWRLLQNAAAAHAAMLSAATEELRKDGQTWMLSKMRLDVKRHPRIGDAIVVETWPSTKLRGARAYRDFVILDERGATLATASSLWVIVDLGSRRPVRIPDAIVALCVDPGYAIPAVQEEALSPPEATAHEMTIRATWSDADQNEHINNVAILRWAVDALPLDFLMHHELERAEVHYRSELQIGDVVRILTSQDGLVVKQAVLNGESRIAALVHLQWRPS
ncbi:acyl-[acyl-carrier-protein] thioesterase [Bryobacter aggregatus]|uniref:acyl-[acyl-carrier-protein] thioesterase n=1 Tax=Bryobacter aggregatus TaxID=360054 RepID=UPI00068ECCC9|nr:acyl-ACP thioesterase domain-containing protein [Bryobacter aggregatus]